jgi:hypothetical protein
MEFHDIAGYRCNLDVFFCTIDFSIGPRHRRAGKAAAVCAPGAAANSALVGNSDDWPELVVRGGIPIEH